MTTLLDARAKSLYLYWRNTRSAPRYAQSGAVVGRIQIAVVAASVALNILSFNLAISVNIHFLNLLLLFR